MYMTRVRNEAVINAETGQETNSEIRDIYIYSSIEHDKFYGGMTAASFIESLKDLQGVSQIVLHINSEGGDLLEGVSIYNLLRNSGVDITAMIEGLCASSASIIAMSANKIIMKRGSIFMIHKPMSVAFGNDEQLSKVVEVLNIITENMTDIYQARTGLARETINDLMSKETYMSGEMAKSLGFCDEYEDINDVEPVIETADENENENDNESDNEPDQPENNDAPTAQAPKRFINFLPVKNRVQDKQERAINLMAGYINGKRNHAQRNNL